MGRAKAAGTKAGLRLLELLALLLREYLVKLGGDLLLQVVKLFLLFGAQLFICNFIVGKDADVTGNFHSFFGDLTGRHIGVLIQCPGGCKSIRSTTANGRNSLVGIDHVAGAAEQKHLTAISDDQQRLEVAEHLVGSPVLGQLHCCSAEIAVILLELRFEAGEEIERVSRGSGKSGQDLVLIEPANLPGRVLNYSFA